MYTLYKQTKPIENPLTGEVIGWETEPVTVPSDFFIQFGLKFDWAHKTVTRKGETFYLDNITKNDNNKIPSPDEWMATYGNEVKTYYFAEGEDIKRNPSNNPDNIKRRVYVDANGINKYYLDFDWDENDRIKSEKCVAPNKEGAISLSVTILDANPNGQTEQERTIIKSVLENTEISVSDLMEELSKDITRYVINAIELNGQTIKGSVTITGNTTLKAVWTAVEVDWNLDYYFDGVKDGGMHGTLVKGDTFSINMSDADWASGDKAWRKYAYRASAFRYNGIEYADGNFTLPNVGKNITLDLLMVSRNITVNFHNFKASEPDLTKTEQVAFGATINPELFLDDVPEDVDVYFTIEGDAQQTHYTEPITLDEQLLNDSIVKSGNVVEILANYVEKSDDNQGGE